jgi:hypothetical protein
VFTARYGLGLYIKFRTTLAFKGSNQCQTALETRRMYDFCVKTELREIYVPVGWIYVAQNRVQ